MSKKIKITERQLKNIVLNNLITEEDTNVNKLIYKRLLKVGRVGEDVRKLQQRLKDLGKMVLTENMVGILKKL